MNKQRGVVAARPRPPFEGARGFRDQVARADRDRPAPIDARGQPTRTSSCRVRGASDQATREKWRIVGLKRGGRELYSCCTSGDKTG